jgi:hypothetical protein
MTGEQGNQRSPSTVISHRSVFALRAKFYTSSSQTQAASRNHAQVNPDQVAGG